MSINPLEYYLYGGFRGGTILYIKTLGFFVCFCLSELIEELASRRDTKIGMYS